MAEIELVIKIPEEVKNRLCFGVTYSEDIQVVCEALNGGTPLPKGHGRLGDLDALETGMVNGIRAGNYEEGYETFAHIVDMDDCVDYVRYSDTIIEADTKESEVQNADSN